MDTLKLFLLALLTTFIFCSFDTKYEKHLQLHETYRLHWTVDKLRAELRFAVNVSTNGWVGFGISAKGKMAPDSDVVMMYVDRNGAGHISDRYTFERAQPVTDKELGGTEDWQLVSAQEIQNRSLFEFKRKVSTGDKFDREIKLVGETNVIWAWGREKPEDNRFTIHYKMGSRPVIFGIPGENRTLPDKDVISINATFKNYEVPREETAYICTYSQLGVPKEGHLVKFEPIIDKSDVVHHMVLFTCRNTTGNKQPWDCMDRMPSGCELSWAWAIGGKAYYTPEPAGIRVGGAAHDYIVLQMHYTNLERKPRVFDNSGVRMYYTPHFRKYDIGFLLLGQPVNWLKIPPRMKHFEVANMCENTCSKGEFTVFSHFLHMHLIGSKIYTEHYRDGILIGRLGENLQWDFNIQEQVMFEKEITVKKGDAFITHCIYDSTSRSTETRGGEATTDEMCFNLLGYYPRIAGVNYCFSKLCVPPEKNHVFEKLLQTTNMKCHI